MHKMRICKLICTKLQSASNDLSSGICKCLSIKFRKIVRTLELTGNVQQHRPLGKSRSLSDPVWCSIFILWQLVDRICFVAYEILTFLPVPQFEGFRRQASHIARHFLRWLAFSCTVQFRHHSNIQYIIRIWLLAWVFFILSAEGTASAAAPECDGRYVRGALRISSTDVFWA